MKIQPPLWIFRPFGQPSYWTLSSHSPLGSMRNTRPKGMSTHHRFPSRSKDGLSRKLATCAAQRLGSDQVVRRFLGSVAGSEVKGRAWMRLIFWKGLCMGPRKKSTKDSSSRHLPPACAGSIALFLQALLDRVLDVLDLVDFDVDEAPADFLDAADIYRLDDVAGLRIDGDRAARAVPFHALGGRVDGLGVGLAAGLLPAFDVAVHPFPAADPEQVRVATPGRG